MRYININKYFIFFLCFIVFFILHEVVLADEAREYIKEFFMKYLIVQIDINEILLLNEGYTLPQFVGYIEGEAIVINEGKLFYRVWFTENPMKIYKVEKQYMFFYPKELKSMSEIRSKEEIFEKIKPILEYFELPEEIDEYKFQLSPARDLWRIIRNPTYEGVPCRMTGFKIDVTSDTCKIDDIVFIPLRAPVNTVPQLDTEQKAREIAKTWLVENEYFKEYDYLGDVPRDLDKSKKGIIVVTFPINAFVKYEIPKEKKEFLYAWEIPFIWEAYGINHGVIWVDVETQKVIGAGPYNIEK